MKAKMSKMAEFWGAETPYSGMGRENHDSGSDGPVRAF